MDRAETVSGELKLRMFCGAANTDFKVQEQEEQNYVSKKAYNFLSNRLGFFADTEHASTSSRFGDLNA